jgi:hypothetical protein
MKSVERLPFAQWADVKRTERFICVEPLSGYRMIQREDEGYVIYLPPDATDDALGQALLEALDKSRFIWPRDEPEFFEADRYMPTVIWIGVGPRDPRGRFPSSRTSVTNWNIGLIFRPIAPSSFPRRRTRRRQARR